MADNYGHKLNPYRKLKNPLAIKGIRQTVVVTNNPSTIGQSELLTVRFPNLGADDVIVPGTAKLAFSLRLNSDDDDNRTIVNNIGRAIVKKITIKIEGNEVFSLDDADVFHCYRDMWLARDQLMNMVYQGYHLNKDGTVGDNIGKLRVNAADKATGENDGQDQAIALAYNNRFCIPLDFEMLRDHMPFYQSGLGDRLSYELTFNNFSRVIKSTDNNASYVIGGISLEYEMVTNKELARMIRNQYQSQTAVYYERVLRHRQMTLNKKDTIWNINLNTPARSMKGILFIFVDPSDNGGGADFKRDTEKYYNPKIKKTTITVEGKPNQLYAHGLYRYQHWDEINKYFGDAVTEHGIHVAKALNLSNVKLHDFLTTKYALWLDLRSTDDNSLHGSGRRVENGSEGITIQLERAAETPGELICYLYVISDAQLNIDNGRLVAALY